MFTGELTSYLEPLQPLNPSLRLIFCVHHNSVNKKLNPIQLVYLLAKILFASSYSITLNGFFVHVYLLNRGLGFSLKLVVCNYVFVPKYHSIIKANSVLLIIVSLVSLWKQRQDIDRKPYKDVATLKYLHGSAKNIFCFQNFSQYRWGGGDKLKQRQKD
jgi:hypothetical protein